MKKLLNLAKQMRDKYYFVYFLKQNKVIASSVIYLFKVTRFLEILPKHFPCIHFVVKVDYQFGTCS